MTEDPDDFAARKRRYTDSRRWTVDRVLVVLTMSISIVALIFSLGVNYQKLAAVDTRELQHHQESVESFVRRDVSAEQWNSVDYRLRQLQTQVDTLTDLVMAQQDRRPAAIPRFSRP